jgi:hypothetical protein
VAGWAQTVLRRDRCARRGVEHDSLLPSVADALDAAEIDLIR